MSTSSTPLSFDNLLKIAILDVILRPKTRETNSIIIDLDTHIDEVYIDMSNDFEDIRMLDNFYQTSSYFPMPVVLVSTLSDEGQTNLGPYSLCFPHLIAEKYAMMLI